jgi:ATP synthase F1 delta subunit
VSNKIFSSREIVNRYAKALFEESLEKNTLNITPKELESILELQNKHQDLKRVIAGNNRLFLIVPIFEKFKRIVSKHNKELTVHVVSAKALSGEQETKLISKLKDKFKREVLLEKKVDSKLIGGMTVRIGSYMVDSSIRSKLERLKLAMKETN